MARPERAPTVLVLDDERYRIRVLQELFEPLVVYGTDDVDEFVKRAERGSWRLIFLDHDLHPDPGAPTGVDAARRLGDVGGEAFAACAYSPVVVHSLNLDRAADIVAALWSWEAPIVRIPFHRLPEYAGWLQSLGAM